MQRLIGILLLLPLTLLALSCGDDAAPASEPQPDSVEQTAQPQATQPASDIRIVSLFGDITEIIFELELGEHIVGRDASSVYPDATADIPSLGFAGALNAEAILALDPTLIIGNDFAGPDTVIEQLRDAGVEVVILDPLKSLDAPMIKLRQIGDLLDISDKAETVALGVERRLDAVLADAGAIAEPLRVLHVYIRRGGLQLVSGEGNEAQTIIEAAGGIDAAAEAGIVGWQLLTPEALVGANPDVYLVMNLGLDVIGGVDALLEIPGMGETRAGQGRHVIAMDDIYLLGFGPRLPEAIAELTAHLRDVQAALAADDTSE